MLSGWKQGTAGRGSGNRLQCLREKTYKCYAHSGLIERLKFRDGVLSSGPGDKKAIRHPGMTSELQEELLEQEKKFQTYQQARR